MIGLDGQELRLTPAVTDPDPAGLAGPPRRTPGLLVVPADKDDLDAYRALRRQVFVAEQGIFDGSDTDAVDVAPATIVLVAKHAGRVVGGVRVAPVGGDPDGGWWTGSRLAVGPAHRRSAAIGSALVRAACATAENAGALRFGATVQPQVEAWFHRLGWVPTGTCLVAGHPHVSMLWPIHRIARLAAATKAPLAEVLEGIRPGGSGWVGDDAAPVPGSDLVAACDAIQPAMVARDPEWAGWCSVLVNVNDLAAMGAAPTALLDAVAAPDVAAAHRIMDGLSRAARAYGVPVIGGHTQIGVPAALAVTAIGRTDRPVPGGATVGQRVRLTIDTTGSWRPGYHGTQWDSTSARTPADLRRLIGTVERLRPTAAKDVSMAGIVGTLGMMAEASGCRAVVDVAAVPRPPGATLGDWLTCFPGFGMLSTEEPGRVAPDAVTAPAESAVCGWLEPGSGVGLRWPDGVVTDALDGPVTGLGTRWA